MTATSIEGGARVGEVNATRRDITSFPLNSPLSIRAISRQRSDRYNRFGLIPVNCRRPKFTSRVPREQAIPHLRQTSTRPIQRHLNNINHREEKTFRSILFRSSSSSSSFREISGARVSETKFRASTIDPIRNAEKLLLRLSRSIVDSQPPRIRACINLVR